MKTLKIITAIFFELLFLLSFEISLLYADGRIICSMTGDQIDPSIISDGGTGAIIVWKDKGTGKVDIYWQKIKANGDVQWPRNGIKVCATNSEDANYNVISDGAGGAIIVWERFNNTDYDIYAQKIDKYGSLLWGQYGRPVCFMPGNQHWPDTVSDGAGGAIIAWTDQRPNNTQEDIYAQRLNANGEPQWKKNGKPVCTEIDSQKVPKLISCANNGAIIAWDDRRNGRDYDIYVQRLGANGSGMWGDNGVVVCDSIGSQFYPRFINDGEGGVIIVWWDNEFNKDTGNIFAQRINRNGRMMWRINGEPVCTANRDQTWPEVIPSGSNSAIIVWLDHRNYDIYNWDLYRGSFDIYAQKIDFDGNVMWDIDGIGVCTAPGYQSPPLIVSDGHEGAIIAWADGRDHLTAEGSDHQYIHDIYAKRINSDGIRFPGWSRNGNVICNAEGNQFLSNIIAKGIISDGYGGAIIVWKDKRNGRDYDIYAQRVRYDGTTLWR